MLIGFIQGLFKQATKPPEEEEPTLAQVKPGEQKSASFEAFLKTPETQKVVAKWSKAEKGRPAYKKRGLGKLMSTLWLLHNSDNSIRNAANDILSSLVGADGLEKLLGALKLAPEGLLKKIKA